MPRKEKTASAGVAVGAILMLVILAGMMLSKFTFKSYGLSDTWPALLIGVGIWFVLGSMLEMGLGIIALSGMWLAHNLKWIAFWDYWPFLILLVAVLVAVGYIRARAASDKG